jgi:hypothetical protein
MRQLSRARGMNVELKVFETILIMIFPIEIFLFFGKLHIVELEVQGIQMKLATTVAGRIAGSLLFLLLTISFVICASILGRVPTRCITTSYRMFHRNLHLPDDGICSQN